MPERDAGYPVAFLADLHQRSKAVGGGEIPRIDGDVAGYGPSSFCGGAAVVLATVKDARRRLRASARGEQVGTTGWPS
jgi:hypothetical protein